jgi:hypothetical protein
VVNLRKFDPLWQFNLSSVVHNFGESGCAPTNTYQAKAGNIQSMIGRLYGVIYVSCPRCGHPCHLAGVVDIRDSSPSAYVDYVSTRCFDCSLRLSRSLSSLETLLRGADAPWQMQELVNYLCTEWLPELERTRTETPELIEDSRAEREAALRGALRGVYGGY